MAKYDVVFSCGHSEEMQLLGKGDERRRKIAYFEKHGLCKACYKQQKRDEDAKAPKIGHVYGYSLGGPPMIAIEVTGQLENNKDALYAVGFRRDDAVTGIGDMLSTKAPRRALMVNHEYKENASAQAWIVEISAKLEAIGYVCKDEGNVLDSYMFRLAVAKQKTEAAEREKRLQEHPKPTRPAWYQAIFDKHAKASFNGKFYGKAGSWRIYVSNTEYRITNAQHAELTEYLAKLAAHRKAMG